MSKLRDWKSKSMKMDGHYGTPPSSTFSSKTISSYRFQEKDDSKWHLTPKNLLFKYPDMSTSQFNSRKLICHSWWQFLLKSIILQMPSTSVCFIIKQFVFIICIKQIIIIKNQNSKNNYYFDSFEFLNIETIDLV